MARMYKYVCKYMYIGEQGFPQNENPSRVLYSFDLIRPLNPSHLIVLYLISPNSSRVAHPKFSMLGGNTGEHSRHNT